MTEILDKLPSNREPVSKITPSVGCGENSVPSPVVQLYDLRKPGGHDDLGRLRRYNGSTCGAGPGFRILHGSIQPR